MLIDFVHAEKPVLGKALVKLPLEKFGQLNLGFGHHSLVEFHLGPAFAIKQHGFFTGLVDEIHAKADQVIDSRFLLIAHSSLLGPNFYTTTARE